MPVISHNPASVFPPYRAYSHATEIRGDARLLVVSGLNGYRADGRTLPESFEDQARDGGHGREVTRRSVAAEGAGRLPDRCQSRTGVAAESWRAGAECVGWPGLREPGRCGRVADVTRRAIPRIA